jgi:hypothetical protein
MTATDMGEPRDTDHDRNLPLKLLELRLVTSVLNEPFAAHPWQIGRYRIWRVCRDGQPGAAGAPDRRPTRASRERGQARVLMSKIIWRWGVPNKPTFDRCEAGAADRVATTPGRGWAAGCLASRWPGWNGHLPQAPWLGLERPAPGSWRVRGRAGVRTGRRRLVLPLSMNF